MFSRFVCKLALLCALPISLMAQSSEADLQTRLINKPLYLRGLWQNDKLHLDAAGKLRGKSGVLSFTLSGIEITKVDLKPKLLVLEGRRMGLEFNKSVPQRVVLQARNSHGDEQIQIEIEAPSDGDYTSTLDAIFTDDLASFIPSLPAAWQNFANKHLLHDSPPSDPRTEQPATPPGVRRIGGGVHPPRLLNDPEPTSNGYARATRISGISTIFVVIDEKGKPSQLSIVRPLGVGLDEDALLAVQQYNFEPSMMGGKPVPVEMDIEVNFTIF